MKRAAAVLVIMVGALAGLTACGDEDSTPNVSNMERCIEAGGDFVGNGWGDECYMQGAPDKDK